MASGASLATASFVGAPASPALSATATEVQKRATTYIERSATTVSIIDRFTFVVVTVGDEAKTAESAHRESCAPERIDS